MATPLRTTTQSPYHHGGFNTRREQQKLLRALERERIFTEILEDPRRLGLIELSAMRTPLAAP